MSEPDTSVARTTRRGALGITLFWLALMGVFYLGFDQLERRQQARYVAHEGGDGELVIPRGPDGHFRVAGRVNGQPVEFLIDTGASSVTVSEVFARTAGLDGGQSVTFQTANGTLPGRLLRNVSVQAAHLGLADTTVAVGLVGEDGGQALLGQSFLRRFDIQILQGEMRLIPR